VLPLRRVDPWWGPVGGALSRPLGQPRNASCSVWPSHLRRDPRFRWVLSHLPGQFEHVCHQTNVSIPQTRPLNEASDQVHSGLGRYESGQVPPPIAVVSDIVRIRAEAKISPPRCSLYRILQRDKARSIGQWNRDQGEERHRPNKEASTNEQCGRERGYSFRTEIYVHQREREDLSAQGSWPYSFRKLSLRRQLSREARATDQPLKAQRVRNVIHRLNGYAFGDGLSHEGGCSCFWDSSVIRMLWNSPGYRPSSSSGWRQGYLVKTCDWTWKKVYMEDFPSVRVKISISCLAFSI